MKEPHMPAAQKKTERQKKTPEERATEALGTAERVHARILEKLSDARQTVQELRAEAAKAGARLQYVGIHPDLPPEERERIAAMFAESEPKSVD
jgi:hypothetical protein